MTGRPRRDGGDDQPLRASWQPSRARARRVPVLRDWRIYAIPLLVVLTVLAVLRVASPEEGSQAGQAGSTAPPAAPVVREAAPGQYAGLNIPAAELPVGGAFARTGAGTWHVVPGNGPQHGRGQVYTYTVEVEDGASVPEGDAAFAAAVEATLADPRSWVGSGEVAVRRIDSGVPDFRISLTSQMTTRSICGYTIPYEASCWKSDVGRVVVNAARWVRAAGAFDGQLGLYRQYAINHEVGHVFGNSHAPCPVAGGLAPVMMQQTFGTSNDYLAQLTAEDPQGTQIPRDGKTCRPNAWPYPQGPAVSG